MQFVFLKIHVYQKKKKEGKIGININWYSRIQSADPVV